MRKIAIGLLAGVAALAGTSAFAADELVTSDAPLLQRSRVVCNAVGECWRSGPRRVIIDDGYGYYPRSYYDTRYYYDAAPSYYDDAPSVGVAVPGFSFGFGPPRPYW